MIRKYGARDDERISIPHILQCTLQRSYCKQLPRLMFLYRLVDTELFVGCACASSVKFILIIVQSVHVLNSNESAEVVYNKVILPCFMCNIILKISS